MMTEMKGAKRLESRLLSKTRTLMKICNSLERKKYYEIAQNTLKIQNICATLLLSY